jgi:predicted O-methyltransferase YrrM
VDYFRKVEPLLSDSAVILADNVLFRGYVLSEEKPPRRFKTIVKRLREYLELVTKTPGYSTEILENGDGLAVTRREK